MAKKKSSKSKASELDKDRKAKPTGLRFKTKDVKALHKKDGDLNKKGKDLYFKRPEKVLTKEEIAKYKRKPDGSFESETKQIYLERRDNRKHSDDNLKKKFKKGGKVKQGDAQSTTYTKKKDKDVKAKPVGKRFTDKLAKKLHKSPNATPTNKDVEKHLGAGVYDEKRIDKSDKSLTKKFEGGGETKPVEISMDEMTVALGREPKYPTDYIDGKKYEKCFLRPFYRYVD